MNELSLFLSYQKETTDESILVTNQDLTANLEVETSK